MRSTVGWLCFGIVVVFVIISVISGASAENYQIIHGNGYGYGYPGQMFQRVYPTIGYRSVVPQVAVRHVEARQNYGDEDSNEEDSDDGEDDPYDPYDEDRYNEELEREEQERIDEDEEFYANGGEDKYDYRRKAYTNKQHHLNATTRTIPQKIPTKSRHSMQKNSNKEDHLNSRTILNKLNSGKRKKPTQVPEETPAAETNEKISNKSEENNEKQKQKFQLKASHVQFVATPIADLILRLSISLAKPIGHGNGTASTFFNVPIRLPNTGPAENTSLSKVETALNKTNSNVTTSSNPLKVVGAIPLQATSEISYDTEIDDTEDDTDIDTLSV